jgi:PAS domain S-box-containing protein
MALEPAPPDLLAALLESLADAVYLVDPDGTVRFVNAAGLHILGYDREDELLGRPSHATIHHSHPDGTPFPEATCPLLRPRTTGETVRVEEDWFVRRDGSFVPVAYSSAPVAEPDGRGAVVVFRDITEQRAAAAQRARAEAGARAIAAADAERRRIRRDIHDGAQQRLVHAAMSVQHALSRLDRDPDEARATLRDVVAEIHAANDDLRELAAGLHPPILTTRGLAAALDSLAGRAPVPVELDAPEERYAPELEAAAYFVVAEALANVAKHADATEARVRVVCQVAGAEAQKGDEQRPGERSGPDGRSGPGERSGPDGRSGPDDAGGRSGRGTLTIEVSDDGRGGAQPADGSGLRGLKDRVETLGGTFALESPPGGGTRLRATFPL